MPLKNFICPDHKEIMVADCLKEGGCRMGERCASRSYLKLASSERLWTGKPSTTQLIQGTMCAFLKLVKNYSISPDQRAFMLHGTKAHSNLEASEDEYSLLEERFSDDETEETGIADFLETEKSITTLGDYKTSGSYKVAKALGFFVDDEPTGEFYKSGKRKGEEKTRKVLKRDENRVDRWEWELQLNKYRIEFEKRGFKVDKIKIQCCVRDGNTYIARSRGVFRNIYYFSIDRLDDTYVLDYFKHKRETLAKALEQGYWNEPCNAKENWDGIKCASYCEVAEFCPLGKYLKKEKEDEDMAIKNLTDIRRLPRLGKIRLGIKKKTDKGVEYPTEVDYFILDPETPSELENKKLVDVFHRLYGEQPKQINIMLPISDVNMVFPQFYKRYGKSTLLQCKGDGVEAVCSSQEFTEGLEVIGKTDMGLPKVKCAGPECPYQKEGNKQCSRVGTLQVLLPELPGSGVWQVTTGSFNSIVNINSCMDYVRAVAGRFHMIPLVLERREQLIQNNGKARKHYVLHINLAISLVDLQKFANIDATKIMLELPEPEEAKEDLLFQENEIIDVEKNNKTNGQQEQPKSKNEMAEAKKTGVVNGKDMASQATLRKIEAIIEAKKWDTDTVKNYLYVTFNLEGIEGLTEAQAEIMFNHIKNQ